jgi:DNA-binding LacI/PurR family transcriptional regulator
MPIDNFPNLAEQVADRLKEGMFGGRWRGTLPGRDGLAAELGVSHRTVEAAMRLLAREGLLISQGPGKRRKIVLPEGERIPRHFRVRILAYDAADRDNPNMLDMLEALGKAGFDAKFAKNSLVGLNMDADRVSHFVQKIPADAWIVLAGSREVLRWFCEQPIPTFALYGIKSGLPIAGHGVRRDIRGLVRHLVALKHRRIVTLVREEHIKPEPSLYSRTFLRALEEEGLASGPYNLPAWGYHPKGLHECLESLFQVTSPTALIIDEALIFIAARDHLARRGIIAPRDISMISLDHDHSYTWCEPQPFHFVWSPQSMIRRVVRWTKNVAQGKSDKRQTFTIAKVIEGGTVGPAQHTS